VKTLLSIICLALANLTFCQSSVKHDFDKFGPCLNYLNTLQYNYSFHDLSLDTLKYEHNSSGGNTIFIQKNQALMEAKIYNRKGKLISSGNLKNGDGKLILTKSSGSKKIYSFTNGQLNDTTFYFRRNIMYEMRIYKDDVMVKLERNSFGKIIANYDSNGWEHDTTFIYGLIKHNWWFLPITHDSYNGKLRQCNVYEHGQLKLMILYNKDGSIADRQKIQSGKRNKYRRNKKCL
jgi:hypothetical protein